jgi:hypothetical protein
MNVSSSETPSFANTFMVAAPDTGCGRVFRTRLENRRFHSQTFLNTGVEIYTEGVLPEWNTGGNEWFRTGRCRSDFQSQRECQFAGEFRVHEHIVEGVQ